MSMDIGCAEEAEGKRGVRCMEYRIVHDCHVLYNSPNRYKIDLQMFCLIFYVPNQISILT